MRSWYPPFVRNAKDGPPPVLMMRERSKARATRLKPNYSVRSANASTISGYFS